MSNALKLAAVAAVASGAGLGMLLHARSPRPTATPVAESPTPAPSATTAATPTGTPEPSRGRGPSAVPTPSRTSEPAKADPLAALAEIDRARSLLAQGEFEPAREAAKKAFSAGGEASSIEAAKLMERATLFRSLTRAIRPHAFAKATDLVEVELQDGAHLARVASRDGAKLSLIFEDGREIEVRKERVKAERPFSAEGFAGRARKELQQRRSGLQDATAIEIYQELVVFSFERGLARDGVPILEEALLDEGGGALIDMFGEGDLEALQRARERLRRDHGKTTVAARPRPARPTPEPGEATPVPETRPDATPTADPGSVQVTSSYDGAQVLDRHPEWKDACEAARDGVDLYRRSFQGKTAADKANVKKARDCFQRAHDLLEKLPRELGEAANELVDRKTVDVNQLLRDVKKRLKAIE